MRRNKTAGIIIYAALLLVAISLLSWWVKSMNAQGLSYSKVVTLFEEEKVRAFSVKDNTLHLYLWEPLDGSTEQVSYLYSTDAFREDLGALFREQSASGVLESYTFLPDSSPSIISRTMPYLLAGLVLIMVWAFLSSRSASGVTGFGKAKANLGPAGKPVKFSDVAGADEEKAELQEVVDFLRDPRKFQNMGAKVPKGVLLEGPPGTGKTLLARAAAGEAEVQFLSISGSDFVELYVGVGASRVRDLFDQAKKMAPAIVFIDEIDAVGRRRGAGMGGGHDEREQTLNQLLVEMDGFQANEGVIVLAATNRRDILDPALLRPGRFDRHIYVGAPDAKGREEILKLHARNKRLAGEVDLKTVALATSGFTGADLENLLNEAAILAVRENRAVITSGDLDEAMMKIIAGPQKRSRVSRKRDLQITAIHEAGHAVAMYFLPTQDPVRQITIIPRGQALGLTVSFPEEDSAHMTRNEMYESIVGLLGGRVAEALFCGDISTGASNDIQRATKLARDMVARYGMSEKIGAVSYESDQEIFVGRDYEKTKSYSEETAGQLDQEVKSLVDRAYGQCAELLKEHRKKLQDVADFLLANETMSGKQFRACMEGAPFSAEGGDSLLFPQE
ncbi:MAG: ATP-dependent zinc metalloprotease FtsH [Candidatus Faecousia sp.]|nr:ATP-dependent zinc metalloprotease FtsH [Clostridiales bacterium]MDD7651213.1 ATP-dependent zinc metalloprotease FtsH [Bacillota bacterium]MDY4220844.1 ATP-dependent zinc metalloprotease FtsH [Candidatus Faecousia sp.]